MARVGDERALAEELKHAAARRKGRQVCAARRRESTLRVERTAIGPVCTVVCSGAARAQSGARCDRFGLHGGERCREANNTSLVLPADVLPF